MEVIFYEDEAVTGLYPITFARPAYDIRSAGYTLFEAAKHVFPKASFSSVSRELVRDASPVGAFSASSGSSEGFLFLNARLAPSLGALNKISETLSRSKEAAVFMSTGALAGFYTSKFEGNIDDFSGTIVAHTKESTHHDIGSKLFDHPEDIIIFNRDVIAENLAVAIKRMRAKKRGLYLGRGVTLPKFISLDTTKGPIVIGDHVSIAEFTVLKGPLFIGESSMVKEFTLIEGGTTIGPVCKVGGEIDASVIDGYSNKQHAGGMGNSYIGRWVNIGGGTFVSELKNTYSTISVSGRDSGAQFLGTIIGDFSKTAVNTAIFPGKVIGASAHLYGIVTEDVPSFTSHVGPGALFEFPVDLAQRGQRAMAMRRGVGFTEGDAVRMEKIFEMTAADREAKKVSKEKISFK